MFQRTFFALTGLLFLTFGLTATPALAIKTKPGPDEALAMLKAGNQRFVAGESIHPHTDTARLLQAGRESQGDHAFATVIGCSDSRVPVERLFDAGVMDLFVIRVAGNVCDVDQTGSIEYGLAHVHTPLLVILGHTQCGAVTAVTQAVLGEELALERNIPPLVDNIQPAVEDAMAAHPDAEGLAVVPYAIRQNVWQGVEDLFMKSPAIRDLVRNGDVKVAGAIYDVGTGEIEWLDEDKPLEILEAVDNNPERAMNAMAGDHDGHAHGDKAHDEKDNGANDDSDL